MYSPRYREEPSISTCEEDRVLRKLTELNVNKYASTDHLVSCYSITAYVTSDHDQYSSALAEHRIGSAASAFENIELGYIHCALKENFSVTLKGFTCVSLIC